MIRFISTISMMGLTKRLLCIGLLLGFAGSAGAFSLLGPFKIGANFPEAWQGAPFDGRPQGLGYSLAGDIGGPMLPFEGYRWNVPVLTYAFDFTFLQYFGPQGVSAVEEAFAILNALPPSSQMSPTLTEFSLDTKGQNGTAAAMGLTDLKSFTLALLVEEMGLANPERFVWGLRGRETGQGFTNYSVIQMNFDPLTIQPTRYVNGVLYNYVIFDDLGPQGGEWASAVEWYQLDPLYQPYSSVAGALGGSDFQLGSSPDLGGFGIGGAFLGTGQYFSGLTRDDAGGLRFLLSTNNLAFDTLLPTVLPRTAGRFNSPWSPVIISNLFGTNITGISNIIGTIGTNFTNFVRTALRPGLDKITFQRVSLLGTNFNPITLRYTDRYINLTNGRVVKQPVERLVLQPDIIFAVRDLGTVFDIPVRSVRSTTANWTNNAALNSISPLGLGGPGTINPPVIITFSDMVPYFLNLAALEGDVESALFTSGLWGSFDGTDRPPVVYPIYPNPSALPPGYLEDLIFGR